MHVCDTSVLIELLENTVKGQQIVKALGDDFVRTTSISIHELLAGTKNQQEHESLKAVLKDFIVLNFNFKEADISAILEKRLGEEKKKVNDADLFISAICISNQAILVTCDNDFKKIKGLNLILF